MGGKRIREGSEEDSAAGGKSEERLTALKGRSLSVHPHWRATHWGTGASHRRPGGALSCFNSGFASTNPETRSNLGFASTTCSLRVCKYKPSNPGTRTGKVGADLSFGSGILRGTHRLAKR